MEKQIGLSTEQLEQLFAQIKEGKNKHAEAKIYNAYLPYVKLYADKYGIKKDQVQDIFTDIFCFLHNNVINEVISASDFNLSFEKLMSRHCEDFKSSKPAFNSELMSMSYARRIAKTDAEQSKKAQEDEFATQSLLFVVQILNELQVNPELAAEKNLSEEKIAMSKDFYGINKEHRRYSPTEIAAKYGESGTRARAMLVSALKAIREMEEFEPIRNHLKG